MAGLAYFVPKPLEDHGYADMRGLVLCATAITAASPLKATPLPERLVRLRDRRT